MWACLALAVALLILPPQVEKVPEFVDRMEVSPASVSILWRSAAGCEVSEADADTASVSVPLGASDYLRGIYAAVNQDPEDARVYLEKAYSLTGNALAASLLSELPQEPGEDLDSQAYELAGWPRSMRFDAARYYLAAAGSCHLAGQHDRAWRNRERGLELLPPGEELALGVEINRRIGQIYYDEGRWDEALPWLWRAAPNGGTPLLLMTRILADLGRFQQAQPLYWQALREYPTHLELYLGGARAALELGDLPQARRFLEGVQPSTHLGLEGLLLHGELCWQIGDIACAEEQYLTVLDIVAHNADAMRALGELSR